MIVKKVSGYTLSTCPWCRKTKKFFEEKNIPFDYIDYDLASSEEQKRIRDEIVKVGGSLHFPFVKINGEVVIGWNPEKYTKLLGL
ncbi:MAG: glutaredoxin family protein [Promethearchaeota archaeon]